MFFFYPAGVRRPPHSIWLYIKYGPTGVITPDIDISERKAYSWMKYPDRELLFVADFSSMKPNWPFTADEAILLDPYKNPAFLTDKILVSAHNAFEDNIFDRGMIDKSVEVMGDSGGAQLRFNVTNYVDPELVIKWMNAVCDIGLILDMPPAPIDRTDNVIMRALMEGQIKNGKIFQERRRPNLKLLNVVHGFENWQLREWISRVGVLDKLNGWALADDNQSSILEIYRTAMMVFQEAPNGQDHIHLLAKGGNSSIPIMAWLGKYIPKLTSDSTSWLMAKRGRAMMLHNKRGGLQSFSLDQLQKKGHRLIQGGSIPCSCKLCSRIHYLDCFNLPTLCGRYEIISYHNLLLIMDYVRQWNEIAHSCRNPTKYVEMITLLNPEESGWAQVVIDFIEHAMNDSLKEAEKEFEDYMVSVQTEEEVSSRRAFVSNKITDLLGIKDKKASKKDVEGLRPARDRVGKSKRSKSFTSLSNMDSAWRYLVNYIDEDEIKAIKAKLKKEAA